MKKQLGIVQAVFPMPVLIVAAYDESGKVQAMNAAWGQICNNDRIALFIDEEHATTQALLNTKAFTVSLADEVHMDVADFLGIASGNKMPDKFARTGYHAVKSTNVNAPIIEEFPVVMECELAEVVSTESFYCIVGRIVNTSAEERILDERGKIAPSKIKALVFDQFQHGYYAMGDQVGKAWNAGAKLKVSLGDTFPAMPIPDFSDKPAPLTPEQILTKRKGLKLSQVKFAAALGVSVKKVSAWEHGKAVPDEAETMKIRNMVS